MSEEGAVERRISQPGISATEVLDPCAMLLLFLFDCLIILFEWNVLDSQFLL